MPDLFDSAGRHTKAGCQEFKCAPQGRHVFVGTLRDDAFPSMPAPEEFDRKWAAIKKRLTERDAKNAEAQRQRNLAAKQARNA